jgi:hypothetical protein
LNRLPAYASWRDLLNIAPNEQAPVQASPQPPLLWRFGIILVGGVTTGLTMLGVGIAFNTLEGAFPAIQVEYANKAIFRDWPGWTESYFWIHPLWFGFVFALGFVLVNRGRLTAGWRQTASNGALYGGLVFFVGSLPVFALLYASFRVSAELILVSWVARNLTQYVIAGVFLGLLTQACLSRNR